MASHTSSPTEAELYEAKMYRHLTDLFFDSPDVFENQLLRHPTQSEIWANYIMNIEPPTNFSLPMAKMTDEMCAQELVAFTERYGDMGFRCVIEEMKLGTKVPLPLFLDHNISESKKAQLVALYKKNWGLAGTRLLRYCATIKAAGELI